MPTPLVDTVPFEWTHLHAGALWKTLREALSTTAEAKVLVSGVSGALVELIHWEQAIRPLWHNIIEKAASASELRPLVEAASKAEGLKAHHERIERFLEGLPGVERANSEPGQFFASVPMPPSLRRGFYGRGYWLSALREALTDGAVALAALEACGGVGKTRLAVEYVHAFRAHYPGGIFWVAAQREETRQEQYHRLLEELVPDIPPLAALIEQGQDVGRLLSRAVKGRDGEKLWVIDNLPEPEPGCPVVPVEDWCPVWGRVHVLITSRRKIADGVVTSLELPPLEDDPAIGLLTHGLEFKVPVEEAKDVVQWIGGLPLALELLGRGLISGDLIWGRVVAMARGQVEVASRLDKTMDVLRREIAPGKLRGVTEAFIASFEGLSDEAKRLGCVLAQFGPEMLPEALVEVLEQNTPKARAQLRGRHFVTGQQPGLAGQMHRVVASFLRAQGQDGDWSLARAAILRVMGFDACMSPKSWPLMEECSPHARAILSRGEHRRGDCIEIVLRIGDLGLSQGLFEEGRTAFRQAFEWGVEYLGEAHEDTLVALSNLAVTMSRLGRLQEAKALQERALEMEMEKLGTANPSTLNSMNNLALTLYRQGDYQAAAYLHRLVLTKRLEDKTNVPEILHSASNLAMALVDAGDFQGALRFQEMVLRKSREAFGEEHPDTINCMNNLANTLYLAGERPEALEMGREAFKVGQRVLGDEHPLALAAANGLARSLFYTGEHRSAIELAERVYRVLQGSLGERHPTTTVSQYNLMEYHLEQDNVSRAKGLLNDLQWLKTTNLVSKHGQLKQILAFIQDPDFLARFDPA